MKFSKTQFGKMQAKAKEHAERNGGEICGLILDNGVFHELIQVRNKTRRGGGFSFYFKEVRAIVKICQLIDHEIVGTFHSHPAGLSEPGKLDLHHAQDDSLMLIFDVTGKSARLWHIKRQKSKPLHFRLI